MSKIFGYYKDDVDRAWYQSSNIKYSECIDHDDALKTLKVVFNNGSQYEYNGVDVNQYLLFREDASQGKALNKYIKGNNYEYKRLEDADIASLEEELNFRLEGGYYIHSNDESFSVEAPNGVIAYSHEGKVDDITVEAVTSLLSHFGKEYKML